jgi:peptide/nickel transport system substrate-binding protein
MDRSGGENPSRTDPAIRRAMAHATNKTFIRDQVYSGLAQVGSALLSPLYGEWYWEPNETEEIEYNITKANEILDAAGYQWRGDKRVAPIGHPYGLPTAEVELTYPILVEQELFEDRATAEYLRDDWKKLGITLVLELVDTAQWNTQVYGYAHDLAMTYWSGDPDPNYLLYTQTTRAIGGWSENAYSSAAYDENYSLTVSEQDHAKRVEYVHNCQKHIYYDCAFIVTVYPYGNYAWRTDTFEGWGDWEAHPFRSISNYYGANPLWLDLAPLDSGDDDWTRPLAIGVGAIAIVAAAAAVAILFMRKRKGKKEEKDVQLP